MRSGRHILVLTLLASACWSQRVGEGLPAAGPANVSMVRQIAQRLTVTLGSVGSAFNPHQIRREDGVGPARLPWPEGHDAFALARPQGSAFQFRLPPPTV